MTLGSLQIPLFYLKDYFDGLSTQYENFSYEYFFASRGQETGFSISDHVAQMDFLGKDSCCYICGAKTLVKSLERVLFDKGLSWLNIHYESFL